MRKSLVVLALAGALSMTTALTPAFAQARTDVKVGLVLEPPSLDPTAEAAAATDEVVYANIFEGLARITSDGSVIPDLAKSWDISADGLVYTFHLVEGAKFHDGTDFNADDVKFSLDRINAEGSLNAQKALYAAIVSVEVVDPATVKVTLKQPDGNLIYSLAWGDAVIVAPESADNNKINPIGTGPFVFKDRVEGDHITLEKNQSYWGTPAKLEGATFRFIGDPTAAFAAVQAGDVDTFPNFPSLESIELSWLIDFRSYFAAEMQDLRALAGDGLVELQPEWIVVTPKGRLLVRAVCMVFDRYLRAQEQRARYSRVI